MEWRTRASARDVAEYRGGVAARQRALTGVKRMGQFSISFDRSHDEPAEQHRADSGRPGKHVLCFFIPDRGLLTTAALDLSATGQNLCAERTTRSSSQATYRIRSSMYLKPSPMPMSCNSAHLSGGRRVGPCSRGQSGLSMA